MNIVHFFYSCLKKSLHISRYFNAVLLECIRRRFLCERVLFLDPCRPKRYQFSMHGTFKKLSCVYVYIYEGCTKSDAKMGVTFFFYELT